MVNYRNICFRLFKKLGFDVKCKLCSKKNSILDPLVIHHKDSNPENDSLKNLEILCCSCHSKNHSGGKRSFAYYKFLQSISSLKIKKK